AHFTLKQFDEVFVPPVWRQPVERALAGAATIKRQHQPRSGLAAPVLSVPAKTKGAMPAVQGAGADFDMFAGRLPDQRPIGKHPGLVMGFFAEKTRDGGHMIFWRCRPH